MNIMIAGGGTGGHLFPGIAVAQELRRRHPTARILFVGTARGIETRAVPDAGFELALLPVSGLRNKSWQSALQGVARLPLAMGQAMALVHRFRPDIAVSVGGYAAGPAVLAARSMGVPCVVMEQNAVAGYTTRALAAIANQVIAAMPCAGLPPHKTRVLGNPVRADLLPVRQAPYAPQTPLRLLVLGGSQGARALNTVMQAAAPLLLATREPPHIIHQTGAADCESVAQTYRDLGYTHAAANAFIRDMATAYSECDLLLCRAGATTLAEVTVCGRPSILVPFPAAAGDHQTANARILADAGAAVHIPQSAFNAAGLRDILVALAADTPRLQHMATRAHALGKPRALADITDALEQQIHHV